MENKKKSKELPIGSILPGGTSTKNKTGSWKDKVPVWDEKKCIHCMICYNKCPENCILAQVKAGKIKRTKTDLEYCKGCGICAKVCPVGAITMKDASEVEEKNKK